MSSVCEETRAEFIAQSYDQATVQSFVLRPGTAASAASKEKITTNKQGTALTLNRDLCPNGRIKINCLQFGMVCWFAMQISSWVVPRCGFCSIPCPSPPGSGVIIPVLPELLFVPLLFICVLLILLPQVPILHRVAPEFPPKSKLGMNF